MRCSRYVVYTSYLSVMYLPKTISIAVEHSGAKHSTLRQQCKTHSTQRQRNLRNTKLMIAPR